MRHARPDYDRIQDPAGLIPEDEPVFLIRAQDACSAETLRAWIDAAIDRHADPGIVKLAYAHLKRFRDWQFDHGTKTPDLPDTSE